MTDSIFGPVVLVVITRCPLWLSTLDWRVVVFADSGYTAGVHQTPGRHTLLGELLRNPGHKDTGAGRTRGFLHPAENLVMG